MTVEERWVWGGAALVVVGFAAFIGQGTAGLMLLVVAPVMTLAMAGLGRLLSRPVDAPWLPNLVVVAYVAKLVGAGVRYHFVRNVYQSGDAFGYYRVGMEFATQWRAGNPPLLSGNRGFGTQVMEWISGVVFVPFMPDFLGGFLLFATLSFIGQLGLYAAFRRWAEPHQLKPFALLVLFLPSYVFWPSSIGKEAVILLGLGIATYFIARCTEAYEPRWLVGAALVLGGVSYIRIHIAGLFVASLLVTALLARPRVRLPRLGARRLAVVATVTMIGLVAADVFQDRYGTDIFDPASVEEFSDSVVDRTTGGGSTVPGGPVSGPADVPEALALVLFRPFLWEARDFQTQMSALETTVLLALVVWKLPAMVRNRRRWRSNALLVFSTVYVIAFSVAFSAVRNLGIIARQRTQVLAFLLMLVIGLGWEARSPRSLRSQLPAPGLAPSHPEPVALAPRPR